MTKDEMILDIRLRAFKAGSQKKLAAACGISHTQLSAFVRGHRELTETNLSKLGYRIEQVYVRADAFGKKGE